MAELNIVTFGMHGVNQGLDYLKDACQSLLHDVIFLQEHWIAAFNMDKLFSISSDYIVFGESAMQSVTSKGILSGRPFGGVAIFAKKSMAKWTQCIYSGDSVVSITIFNSLYINTYFP